MTRPHPPTARQQGPGTARRHPLARWPSWIVGLVVDRAASTPLSTRHHGLGRGADGQPAPVEAGQASCSSRAAPAATASTPRAPHGSQPDRRRRGRGRLPGLHRPHAGREPGAESRRSRRRSRRRQIDALAAYVASLGGGPAIPTADELDSPARRPRRGGELFRTNCAQCHNFAGAGGALTQGKYAPTLNGATPTQIYEAMLTGPQAMPVFNDGR